ncbi:hypothetical protein F2Q69_00006130 [Brassica cretica]|uniref:Uncharacterized protein n=1 Tax=Brassica cretica TaxID=69181 RepID=A0A8S9PED8_BRACR|nr:hypothetical protein F2Q69_00006130 [Brassica cretica]
MIFSFIIDFSPPYCVGLEIYLHRRHSSFILNSCPENNVIVAVTVCNTTVVIISPEEDTIYCSVKHQPPRSSSPQRQPPPKVIDIITEGAIMLLEAIVGDTVEVMIWNRDVDVEKRRSQRIMTLPVPFYTLNNGEPSELQFMSSESKIRRPKPKPSGVYVEVCYGQLSRPVDRSLEVDKRLRAVCMGTSPIQEASYRGRPLFGGVRALTP